MVCNILSMEELKVSMVEFKSSMEEITEIAKSPQWLKSISPWIVSVSPWGIRRIHGSTANPHLWQTMGSYSRGYQEVRF